MNLSYFRSFYLANRLKINFCESTKFKAFSTAVSKEDDEGPADEAQEQLFLERREDLVAKGAYFEKRRNKSRLYPQHRNIVHDKVPWTEDTPFTYVKTVRYNRRLYGRYGNASKVDPRIAWPTKEDLAVKEEYENLSCPKTIQQMVEEEKEKIRVKEKEILEADARMAANFTKMNQWKEELKAKLTKRAEEANKAKSKRARMIEEIRRLVGYEIDPRTPKFQEMMEQKEKEEKKALKEAKKKQRQDDMIARMLQMAEEDKKERVKKQEQPSGADQTTKKE